MKNPKEKVDLNILFTTKLFVDNPTFDEEYIFIKCDRKYCKIFIKDILFVEALSDYVIVQTATKKYITKMYLKTMENLLPKKVFFRINKSYIVNLKEIDSFNNNDVFIKSYEIGIGRSYKEEFYKRLIAENT